MTIADRFTEMVRALAGDPLSEPPALSGRVFKAPDCDDGDPVPQPPASPGRMIPRRRVLTLAERERCAGPDPPKPAISTRGSPISGDP